MSQASHTPGPDTEAELEILDLLIREARSLGKHGAAFERRKAALRVEERLTQWRNEITPELALATH